MHSLPLFHRIAGSRVVVIGSGDMAAAKRRLVERAGGICVGEAEAHHARLAFVALKDPGAAQVAALRLKRRGLLVNVADRPDLCDFTLPSVLERGDVLVAVATGGASAGLAKHLRLRLEELLPPSLGALAAALAAARERLRARWPDAAERRRALDLALARGGALDVLDGDAAGRVDGWLTTAPGAEAERTITISLASDDPDDLTLRQARLLGTADTIIHDNAVPPAILSRARADAVRCRATQVSGPFSGLTVVLRAAPGAYQTSLPASLPSSSK
jgi:uroporphyrin-III C-methyltransferase / precorrin-2 dehydrogenase / sirohydrochlorin ferrochelatase